MYSCTAVHLSTGTGTRTAVPYSCTVLVQLAVQPCYEYYYRIIVVPNRL
jgi:hypothetical protein